MPVSTIDYTAIGASDAAGYGATVTCNTSQNPVEVALPTCPGGTAYVPDIERTLAAQPHTKVVLNDLGISGAVVGPKTRALIDQYGSATSSTPCVPRTGTDVVPGDFITNELPSVPANATLVTIFAGGNDTNGIVNAAACMTLAGNEAGVPAFLATSIAQFGAEFEQLVTGIEAKAPSAKIVVANLPNFAAIPFAQTPEIAPVKPLLQAVSVGIDTTVYEPAAVAGLPVVDLLCNPASYVTTNFYTDGFHPDDAGYAVFATAFVTQILAATPTLPQTSCSYMAISSGQRRALQGGIPNFNHR
ncbi:MAG: SGNH/GDSL hydrolase family protein [Candidatus Eremiobacteraeota bacterium]|nr:SGNH/GDSL hydrolase family protein [Candidatus Eremiobacteraeota bacterium]